MSAGVLALIIFLQAADPPPLFPLPEQISREEYERRARADPGKLAAQMRRQRAWESRWLPIISAVVDAPSSSEDRRTQVIEDSMNGLLEAGGVRTPRVIEREAMEENDRRQREEIARLEQWQATRDAAAARNKGEVPPSPADNPPRPERQTRPQTRDVLTDRRREDDRAASEKASKERAERVRLEKEQAEQAEKEKTEKEKVEKEKAEKAANEQAARDRAEQERRQKEEEEKKKKEEEEAQQGVPVLLGKTVDPDFVPSNGSPLEPPLDPCAFAICQDNEADRSQPIKTERVPICWQAICMESDGEMPIYKPITRGDICIYAICLPNDGVLPVSPRRRPGLDPTQIRSGGERRP